MHKISQLGSILVAAVALLLATVCAAREKGGRDGPSVNLPCPECGVIYAIRKVKRERESARNQEPDAVPVGPMIRFSLGDKADHKPHVDVVGSRSMREAMAERYYEEVVRFDDNRWQWIELPDATSLKTGDRVHVHRGQIEPDDGDKR